jgi:hypothetical protein
MLIKMKTKISLLWTFSILSWEDLNDFQHNLPLSCAGDDYKNDYYVNSKTSGDYIQLVEANFEPVDLLYNLGLILLVKLY